MDKNESSNLRAKLHFLTSILKLGHETFHKKSTNLKVVHILNNSSHILSYDRACVIQYTGKKTKIIGTSGTAAANQHSEYSLFIVNLIKKFTPIKERTVFDASAISEKMNLTRYEKVKNYIDRYPDIKILVVPLFPFETDRHAFYWIMEYFDNFEETEIKKTSLLAEFYREALWYSFYSEKSKIRRFLYGHSIFTPGRIFFYSLICFIFFSLLYHVNLNVNAEFEIVPKEKEIVYAPFSGIIKTVYHKDGERIRENELIIEYDTEEYQYQLAKAEAEFNTENTRLDYIRQYSFRDKNELGKIKILSYKKDIEKIKIEEMQWYLKNSELKTKIPGMLVIDEKYEFEGKYVRAGDKLFEVIPNNLYNAKIYLNQNDSSVIENITSINLYLYNRPIEGLPAEPIFIGSKPEITVNNQFCYVIKAKFSKNIPFLYYGMRGIARINGERVTLAYYIIRNIVLWWRKY